MRELLILAGELFIAAMAVFGLWSLAFFTLLSDGAEDEKNTAGNCREARTLLLMDRETELELTLSGEIGILSKKYEIYIKN